MSTLSFWTSRRRLLGAAATAGVVGLMPAALRAAPAGDAIRPFRVNVPHADLDDLRRRVLATRWPANETVADQSQGVQLAKLQRLVRYWGTDYDWRKGEAKLNALPMFVTEIDGLDIQFIHVRSRHENAMPLIMSHGWPGPRSWVERSYHKLIYFNEVDKGGHFAAWDEPELFSTEVRAAFTSDLCAEGSSL
jgi:pimeloyl-ACP methyl ester carboxylesterase